MDTSEYQKIEVIVRELKLTLPGDFSLKSDDKWIIEGRYESFDLTIFYKNSLYAIIDIKTNLSSAINSDGIKNRIKGCVDRVGCRFGVLTDGRTGWFYDNITKKEHDADFEEIIKAIILPTNESEESEESDVLTRIESILVKNGLKSYQKKLERDISSVRDWRFTSAKAEQDFFEEILNNEPITYFYRYTSLSSLITMLDKGTYQMCGIAGMNDKSEINYFDSRISESKSPLPERICNDVYISSGTSRIDDLTMWRLYGDDGKGVCLEFEVTQTTFKNFHVAKVDYEYSNKQHNSHKWVEVIKDLGKAGLKFNNLNVWKHFFKPCEYSVEDEIRLLFNDNDPGIEREWILANGSSIIIPVVRYKFLKKPFPLKLRKIILGPKMGEREINKAQLGSMLSSKSISGIRVECSKISNYR